MKKVAPIIIFFLICGGLLSYVCAIMIVISFVDVLWLTIVLSIISLGIIIILVAFFYILIARLKEIDKEDDDDISKY